MYDKPDVSEGESLQKTSIGYEHISNRQFFCVTRESGERPNKNESQARLSIFYGEFDPGSGRTLAACLTHASRTGGFFNTEQLRSWQKPAS